MGRVVYEHADGRPRVSAEEADFASSAEANPYNAVRTVVDRDGRVVEVTPGRTGRKALTLEAEGFYPVARIDPATGAEVPLEEGGEP